MFQGVGEREKFSHLTICTIRVGTDSVLFSLPCPSLSKLELEFQVHVHSEALDGSWRWYTAYLFTPEHCVVFEVVGYRRTYIDVVNSPSGRPHWSGSF